MRSFPLMLLGVMYSSPHGGNLMLIHPRRGCAVLLEEVNGMFDHDVGVLDAFCVGGGLLLSLPVLHAGPLRSPLCGSCKSWIVLDFIDAAAYASRVCCVRVMPMMGWLGIH
ncbi:hypothetical protein Nepgr_032220 [Nepenthes gracilis]|uniref:Uncharacterized protein n=1 Tax=Nepenthes gracilis TaxID=150966 RepID=A0AAD3TKF2_NEPGR|nr:hypothetical protein Nepgr_032220 [Nepenthes gracilis]